MWTLGLAVVKIAECCINSYYEFNNDAIKYFNEMLLLKMNVEKYSWKTMWTATFITKIGPGLEWKILPNLKSVPQEMASNISFDM